jgi:hypothetical protein
MAPENIGVANPGSDEVLYLVNCDRNLLENDQISCLNTI